MDSFDGFFLFVALAIAVLAWMSSRKTRRRANERLSYFDTQLSALQKTVKAQAEQLAALQARAIAPAPSTGPIVEAAIVATPIIAIPIIGAPSSSIDAPPTPALQAVVDALPLEAIPVSPGNAAPGATAAAASAATAPAPISPLQNAAAKTGEESLEEKIALVWFTRIGALAMLVGVAFFFKYAVDNDWIGPLGRVALGVLAGLGVLVFAEATRARTKATYLQVLIGVGLSFLFVSAYASFALYHLIPSAAAFAAIGVVTLLGGALSIRHRGEGVLILSLLAGFMCPVLLSTGKDLPGPLFAYLFVLTALGFATSVRMGFRYATWLGIGGTTVLFAGWYQKFFDVSAAVHQSNEMGEDVILSPAGNYFPFRARIIPLIGTAVFLGEWIAVWWQARKSEHKKLLQPVALLVTALLLAHVSFSALLYDKQLALGFLLAGLALLSSFLLAQEERRELLALPLLASFIVLLKCAQGSQTEPGGMLAVLGLTFLIYAGGIARGQLGAGISIKPSERTVQLLCGAGVCLAIVSAVLLLELHPTMFAFVLAVLSLAYAALAAALRVPIVATGAVVLSFAGLLVSEPHGGTTTPIFLLAAGLWAVVYFATTAWDLLSRKLEATPARLFTISGAGLGFAAIVEVNAGEHDWFLRAATLAIIGALDLAVGANLLRRGVRRPATVLLGQALGLFAAAAATIFSGAAITIVWALLAAVVAVLAAADEDPYWLAGAVLLFCCTAIRLLSFDLQLPGQQQDLFLNTLGAAGVLRQTFLFNARALAFIGTGTALLVSARALARKTAAGFPQSAFAFAAAGHLMLLAIAVMEIWNLYLKTPSPGTPVTDEFRFAFFAALGQQERSFSMIVTVVMSVYAAMLVSIGFGFRNQVHRFLGLGLFALALTKLVIWDVWHLPRIEQMVVLVAMGGLLLGSSYLYARFGKRLVSLLRDGELAKAAVKPGGAALLVLLTLGTFSSPARAVDPSEFLWSRTVTGVEQPGLHRVEIDPALYTNSASQLSDLRIFDSQNIEVPYLVRAIQPEARLVRHDATVVDPLSNPDGSTSAILDLGQPGLKHSEVELEISGADFLRRTRVEVSSDEVHFHHLAEGAIVYRVNSGDSSGAGLSISYPVSDSRYVRVTLLPGADRQLLRITGAHLAYTTVETRPPMRWLDGTLSTLPRKADATSTWLMIDLGASGVPIDSLQLDFATPLFERRASVRASDDQQNWAPIGSGLVYRSAAAVGLTLHFYEARQRYLRVQIEDGNDPPLAARSAKVGYRPAELIFRASNAGPLTIYLGNPHLAAPVYDLAAVVARSGESLPIHPATFGAVTANPAFHPPVVAPPPPPPLSERYKTLIISVLGLLLLGLALWTIRLLRAPDSGPGDPPA